MSETPEPEQQQCGTTHYHGCACHELGWHNKWHAAIGMGARAQADLHELREAVRELKQAKGRYHTQQAAERLFGLVDSKTAINVVTPEPLRSE